MAVAKITKTLVDKLPPGALVWDTEIVGLGVRRQTTEARHYVLRYPIPQRGTTKQRVMSIGRHGTITVDKARTEAKRLLGLVASERDPLAERREAKAPRPVEATFGQAVERYITFKTESWKPGTARQITHHIRTLALPLHPLALTEIDRAQVARLLGSIQTNSGPTACNRTRTSLQTLFKWLDMMGEMPEGRANPASRTFKAKEARSRDRVLTDGELTEVWRALGDDHYSDVLRLLILTGQRANEIAQLQWSEIDFDRALITLPPARTKNSTRHELPLAPAALTILRRWANRGAGARANDARVFEGIGWTCRKAKLDATILAKRRQGDRKTKPMPHWTIHDLRRSAATGMAGLKVLPHIIETVLNHLGGFRAGVAGTYNRNTYAAEMRAALCAWADHVEAIIGRAKIAA